MLCNLCKKKISVLQCVNLKRDMWMENGQFQLISTNDEIKNYELDLCEDCYDKIFARSRVCITFSKELLDITKKTKQEITKEINNPQQTL